MIDANAGFRDFLSDFGREHRFLGDRPRYPAQRLTLSAHEFVAEFFAGGSVFGTAAGTRNPKHTESLCSERCPGID